MNDVSAPTSLFTEHDIYLFKEGNQFRLYQRLGAHPQRQGQEVGTRFAVWAPNAERVTVIGDFNDWQPDSHPLQVREDGSGIWEGFVPGVGAGATYKYHITSRYQGYKVAKADPFARRCELPPGTASIVWEDPGFAWQDERWMQERPGRNAHTAPWSIYEVHLGSWRRGAEGGFLSYRELADQLAEYCHHMGYTHVELLPITEHPFYGSWGYQTTGYFAPTARYGTPEDFMYFVDRLHRQNIGVILDWVPSHFPSDEFGLVYFDGSYLYEHADPQRGFHPEWNSYIYNYGRNEVRAFLISSAMFWMDVFHIDALRVDAVASMLYLDYARKEGEWVPNPHGGKEDLDAIHFLRRLNETIYRDVPGAQSIAEESTAWPMVSKPTDIGGLGFGMKWNMGWMHDTLNYFTKEPVHRSYHQDQLTFSIWYAFSENFVLSLSHDEVVYGKGSLLRKMPGDDWQKFANLRLLFGYLYAHPGKKLHFMGGEFGQWNEWNHEASLDWHLLEHGPHHQGLQRWVRELNHLYRARPALHELDFQPQGFEWIDFHDRKNSVLSFIRRGSQPQDELVVVFNFTPVPRHNYQIGVPHGGFWREVLNSDAADYGGAGHGNLGRVEATPVAMHGYYHSLSLTLPPLGVLFLERDAGSG